MGNFFPCLYIFESYYFHYNSSLTTNAINSLSSVYMFTYPVVIHFTIHIFDNMTTIPGNGLKRIVLYGGLFNTVGALVRWLGASPSSNSFIILFIGQTIGSFAQVLLAIPPQLAVTWFPKSEINFATAIAVSANNLGIAFGCILSPAVVKEPTMMDDIPRLLLCQFIMCSISLVLLISAFQKPAPFNPVDHEPQINFDDSTSKRLFKEKNFIYMLIAYGAIMGAQCSVITLIAQILLPPFSGILNENDIGLLAAITLSVGVPGSIIVGHYLDKTKKYSKVCNILVTFTTISIFSLYISIEYENYYGVLMSCILFGISSYSTCPALFQYAGELFHPIREIIPTSYLFLIGNIGGVILVALMGFNENIKWNFSMRLPMIFLMGIMIIGNIAMIRVKGVLKRSYTSIL
ncbi:unnamed protein product [Cunninghamella echinulata]